MLLWFCEDPKEAPRDFLRQRTADLSISLRLAQDDKFISVSVFKP